MLRHVADGSERFEWLNCSSDMTISGSNLMVL